MKTDQSVVSNPVIPFLNKILEGLVPKINTIVDKLIVSEGYDPWKNIDSGKVSPGSINLGICSATVYAEYYLKNLTGLSSLEITEAEVVSLNSIAEELAKHPNQNEVPAIKKAMGFSNLQNNSSDDLSGNIAIEARLNKSLSLQLGGSVGAKCGFIHPSVGLGGSISVNSITGSGSGNISVSAESGKVCLSKIQIENLSFDFSNIDVSINGLGIFNVILDPLVNLFKGVIKDKVLPQIESLVKSKLNDVISGELPQCLDL
ncbi:hypothetical protein [Tenacibaculum xiamenense]|uniref:hypothetical protein n=1 Tax=Tenacibaculum xiamenense TaxID=1261553 RepID=UPI003892F6C1